MREKDLYRAIDKLLPVTLHRQSMTGASMTANGTPDRYYDGPSGDLWVEYKMLKHMPRSGIAIGDYTAMQLAWMERRYHNSRNEAWGDEGNIVGIVGLPNRTAVIQRTPKEWREGSPITNAIPLSEVSEWIRTFVGAQHEQPPAGVGSRPRGGELSAKRRIGMGRVSKKQE